MITTEYEQLETLSKQVAELQLKASIAMELLKTRIDTMEVNLMVNGFDFYSPEDLSDYLRSCNFLNEVTGSKYDTRQVRQYLDSL